MCKEEDAELPYRNPNGIPPPPEKAIRPEDAIHQPIHVTQLASRPSPLEGIKAFQEMPLSDVTDSQG